MDICRLFRLLSIQFKWAFDAFKYRPHKVKLYEVIMLNNSF